MEPKQQYAAGRGGVRKLSRSPVCSENIPDENEERLHSRNQFSAGVAHKQAESNAVSQSQTFSLASTLFKNYSVQQSAFKGRLASPKLSIMAAARQIGSNHYSI